MLLDLCGHAEGMAPIYEGRPSESVKSSVGMRDLYRDKIAEEPDAARLPRLVRLAVRGVG
jgi:hypothetical protein